MINTKDWKAYKIQVEALKAMRDLCISEMMWEHYRDEGKKLKTERERAVKEDRMMRLVFTPFFPPIFPSIEESVEGYLNWVANGRKKMVVKVKVKSE